MSDTNVELAEQGTDLAQLSELDQYKARVRAEAIRVAGDQGWCREGLNETLDNLGLDRQDKLARNVKLWVTVQVPFAGEDSYEIRSEARERAIAYAETLTEAEDGVKAVRVERYSDEIVYAD